MTVAGHQHYVPQGLELNVKPGDTVEAGDALSDGLVSPADVIRHKGIGEGRRYYAERYKKILDDSGYKANLRNAEAMARAAIDHVDVGDEGVADYLPDDTVSYNRVSALYTPSEDAKTQALGHDLVGKYLQAPALHYSIGTRITPSVLKRLDRAKVMRVTVSGGWRRLVGEAAEQLSWGQHRRRRRARARYQHRVQHSLGAPTKGVFEI